MAIKFIDEFRNGEVARRLANTIAAEVRSDRRYNIMEFCGGHTHAIFRYGVQDLLPKEIDLIHGPGCPVCVLPMGRVDNAIELALRPGVILATYADLLRVPGSHSMSLMKAKAQGADVRMIYAASDAVKIARENPEKEVVFFAIGFETTTPPTAAVIREAESLGLRNFSVFCNHVLTPPAINCILATNNNEDGAKVDGFIGPAHVSVIIGTKPYEYFTRQYGRPVVIAGFEPLDVIQSVLMLVRQINEGRAEVQNEYTRAVTHEGNRKAQELIEEVFQLRRSFELRGLGSVPYSAIEIKEKYSQFDAERRFGTESLMVADHKACECAEILRGLKRPEDCRVFGTVCTPDNPIGSCMVSSEGACAAHYAYGRYRQGARHTAPHGS